MPSWSHPTEVSSGSCDGVSSVVSGTIRANPHLEVREFYSSWALARPIRYNRPRRDMNASALLTGLSTRLRMLIELIRVVWLMPRVELQRQRLSLHAAVKAARLRASTRARSAAAREQLRQAIAAVDRRMSGGPNCVRRVLLEMNLDRAAAADTLLAGFKAGGGESSGHAWLASHPDPDRRAFDAIISI